MKLVDRRTSWYIPQRFVFAILGFIANVIGFMMMLSLDVTISHIAKTNRTMVYDYNACPNIGINKSYVHNFTKDENIAFIWSEKTQSNVLGAFLMGYIWTQWPGGWAAEVFGGKTVLTICMLTASISTMLTPVFTAYFEEDGLYYMMFISGLAVGPLVAVLISVMSKWVPKREQNFIGAIIFPGAFIGQFIVTYLAGLLNDDIGWEVLFYTIGTLGVIWCVLWHIFCSSTPNMHPFISEAEKKYLNDTVISLIRTTNHDYDPLPWKPYFYSSTVWGLTIGYMAVEFINYIVSKQLPLFMSEVYRMDINDSAIQLSTPYLCAWVTALVTGFICDFIVPKKLCNLKRARQVITGIGAIGSSICIIMSVYSNCSPSLSIIWIYTTMGFFGTFYSGIIINVIDIVPNYAGNTMGVITNLAVCSVYILSYLQNVIVKDSLLFQWRIYIWVMAPLIVLCEVFYLFFIETDQLWWDDVRKFGYPDNWKRGLLPADGLIATNGDTIAKPKTTIEKSV